MGESKMVAGWRTGDTEIPGTNQIISGRILINTFHTTADVSQMSNLVRPERHTG